MPSMKEIKSKVESRVDSIGKNKDGTITFRRTFFYRMGGTDEQFRDMICKALREYEFDVIEFGEHWAAFRGGSSVRNSSHWYVTLKFKEK